MHLPVNGELFARRFLVEGPVASGGMGVIFRAVDRDSGKPVALKLLQHLGGATEVERSAARPASSTNCATRTSSRTSRTGSTRPGGFELRVAEIPDEALRRSYGDRADNRELLALGRGLGLVADA